MRSLSVRRRRLLYRACFITALSLSGGAAVGQVNATWTGPVSGTWTNPIRWSTNPVYPDGPAYNAFFSPSAANRTATLSSDITLNNLTIADSRTTLLQTSGTLTLGGTLSLTAGTYRLGSGTLAGATLGTSGSGRFVADPSYAPAGAPSPVFDHVTLAGAIGVANLAADWTASGLVVRNGLTVLPGGNLQIDDTATFSPLVQFQGDQTIGGTGELSNIPNLYPSVGSTLTIAPTVTVRPGPWGALVGMPASIAGAYDASTVNYGTFVVENSGLNAVNFTNHGAITATNSSVILTGNWSNAGTISVNGGSLYLDGTWTNNTGTISATNATVHYGGTFTAAQMNNVVARTGGSVVIAGTLDNTGDTLVLDAVPGASAWPFPSSSSIFSPAGVKGGTVTVSNPAAGIVLPSDGTITQFDGVALGADVTLTGSANLSLLNNVDLNGHTISISAQNSSMWLTPLRTNGPATIGGTGRIILGASSYANNISPAVGAPLTIGPGVSVVVGNPSCIGYPTSPLTLQGAVTATNDLTLFGANIVNTGTIEARDHATVYIGGSLRSSDLGTLKATNGGKFVLAATVDNAGQTLTATADTGILTLGWAYGTASVLYPGAMATSEYIQTPGGIVGGTLAATAGGGFRVTSGLGLDGVTVAAPVTFDAGAILRHGMTLQGATVTIDGGISLQGSQTIGGTGTLAFTSGYYYPGQFAPATTGLTLTFAGPSLTVQSPASSPVHLDTGFASVVNEGTLSAGPNTSLSIADPFTNTGTLEALPGAAVTLGGNWSSPGILRSAGGNLVLGGTFAGTSLAHLQRTTPTGTVSITGTVINAGSTLSLSGGAGLVTLATGARINGGTLSAAAPSSVTVTGSVTLDNVNVDADVSFGFPGTSGQLITLTAVNNLSIAPGRALTLSGGLPGTLLFSGGQTVSGPGTIAFGSGGGGSSITSSGTGPVTFAPNLTIATGNYSGTITSTAAAPFVNLGTIAANTPGQYINLDGPWSGNGALVATAGNINLVGSSTGSFLSNISTSGAGQILISGSVNNTGNTLNLTSPITLRYLGQFSGGTLTASTAGPAVTVTDSYLGGSPTLANLTLAANVQIPNYETLAFSNVTLANSNISLSEADYTLITTTLSLPGAQTLAGNGLISFDGTVAVAAGGSQSTIAAGTNVTLAPGITVATGFQSGSLSATGTLVNQGTFSASTAGRTLAFTSGTLVNQGAIRATNGGVVSLAGTWSNTGTISANGGTLLLAGTSAAPGVVTATNASVTLSGPLPNAPGSSFADTAVTVAAGYTTPQLLSLPLSGTSSLLVGTGGAVNNASYSLNLTSTAAPWRLAGGSITGGSIGSPDATPLLATTGSSSLTGLTLSAPLTVSAGATVTLSTVTNTSTITLNSGATLAAGPTSPGAVVASPGSTLTFTGSTSALAAVAADAATLTASSNTNSTAAFRSLNASNSTYRLATGAVLDNTGDDLHLTGGNAFALAGGTISGGTISNPFAVTSGGTLASTTLASELTIAGNSTISATGSFTLSNGLIHFTSPGTVVAPATLTGTGEVVFDNSSGTASLRGPSTGAFTIGPNITVRTGTTTPPTGTPVTSYYVGNISGPSPLINQGTISAQTPGATLTVYTSQSSFTNTGTLEARNNSTLRLLGTFSTASLAALATTSGGASYVVGSLDNTSATLTLTASHAIGLGTGGGNLRNGYVTTPDNTSLTVYRGSSSPTATTVTLTSVDVDAPVVIPAGLGINTTSTGTLTTTLRRAVTGAGATVNLNGNWSLPGSLSLSAGSTLNLNTNPSGTLGPISLIDSVANVSTAALSNPSLSISLSPSSTLNVGTATTSASITGGTINGGTTTLYGSSFLSGVTLAGNLTVANGAFAELRNGTLNNAHISITSTGSYTALRADSSLLGTGDISFDSTYPFSTLSLAGRVTPFTIPAGITVRTGTGGGNVSCDTMAGTISAQTSGKGIYLSVSQKTTGTVEARNGGSVRVSIFGTGSFTGPSNALTIPSGSWNVYDGSTIVPDFTGYAIVTIASPTSVTLSGPTSKFDALSTLATNAGSLTLTAGRSFTTAGNFTNSGSVTLGPSSALKVTGVLANTGAISLTSPSSALVLDYTGSSPLDSLRNDLLTHHLTTPLPNTAIAYFESSLLNLTSYAGLPVDSTTLLTKVTFPGDANLDGKLNADDYALLDRSFARSLANPHWTDGDFNYDGLVTGADYFTIDTAMGIQAGGSLAPNLLAEREAQFGADYVAQLVASVPEPGGLPALLGVGLAIGRRVRARRYSSSA